MRKGETVELAVVRLDEDGLGVGTAAGLEVHVPAAVPGDRIAAVLEHQSPHAARAWGRLAGVLQPSPDRVAPACPNVGRCGGCLLQCVAYPVQLAAKQARVQQALGALCEKVHPIVPSPRTLGYRNKAKLVAARGGEGRLILGSYEPRSHHVIDMAGCRVTEAPLDEVARTLAEAARALAIVPFDERARAGELRYAVLRSSHEGRVLAVLVAPPDLYPERGQEGLRRRLGRLAETLAARHPEIVGVVLDWNPARDGRLLGRGTREVLLGAGVLRDRVGALHLHLSAGAFFQVNREQAAALYAAVVAAAEPRPGERAIDAYAGVGGIALALAARGARVLAIEAEPESAACARRSAEAAGLPLEALAADAALGLAAQARADLVVLNPPRKGCAPPVLEAACGLGPRAIVYVSCAPESLARDLAHLDRRGYRALWARPFDLLPHTPHVETLTLLRPHARAG